MKRGDIVKLKSQVIVVVQELDDMPCSKPHWRVTDFNYLCDKKKTTDTDPICEDDVLDVLGSMDLDIKIDFKIDSRFDRLKIKEKELLFKNWGVTITKNNIDEVINPFNV